MRLALVEPDIAPNLGAIIRLGACMGLPIDVIEPCGFPFSLHAVRRSAMDYADRAEIARYVSWTDYESHANTYGWRLVMLTPEAQTPYTSFAFGRDDVLVLGSESVGLPSRLRAGDFPAIAIPMEPGLRSLNVALAASMVCGEALRQTGRMTGAGARNRMDMSTP